MNKEQFEVIKARIEQSLLMFHPMVEIFHDNMSNPFGYEYKIVVRIPSINSSPTITTPPQTFDLGISREDLGNLGKLVYKIDEFCILINKKLSSPNNNVHRDHAMFYGTGGADPYSYEYKQPFYNPGENYFSKKARKKKLLNLL